ncbi:GNAT family N-acetyltransferase [Lacticaseibacillus brantae]|uniref:N-acetyltransferase domain-containing protein n=1 Tax=Lacticaseibacillus brantae DSM 23927 TaxID=1423727 RepID=A0A0R2B2K1_9LACO|nr:GNAT family N-acetyltransferase [Lacticaseibacillus brantae]KRM72196.1 hypothetical protein FC34_GL001180 [Lacticaseibacillus brantae DSM 23927]
MDDIEFIPLTVRNLSLALPIYEANRAYYDLLETAVSVKTIEDDLVALPAGVQISQKHFGVIAQQGRPLAVLDVVTGYPGAETAYIGLLLVADKGRGIGGRILVELETRLKASGYQQIGLAVLRNNPRAQHFWTQQGFTATGAAVAQAGSSQVSVISYQKPL